MKYGNLTGIDKKVSRMIFGTPAIHEHRETESFQLLDDVFSLGINTFDTAAVYGNGSEQVLMKWMHERGIREEVVLVSKCAHPNRWRKRVTSFDIMSDLSDALAKPCADYIDVYQLHRDDESVPVAEIIDTMNRLYEQGKVKSFGASNWSLERVIEAREYALRYNLQSFTSVSPHFSLGEQVEQSWDDSCVSLSGMEHERARQYYEEIGMPVFAYSSLCRGFFSGKFKSDDIEKAKELLDMPSQKGYMHPCNFERLRRAEILAEEKGVSVASIALAWVLAQPLNTFLLVSASSKDRMEENTKALDVILTNDEKVWLNLESKGNV